MLRRPGTVFGSNYMPRNEVYRIPVSKIGQSLTECFKSALNFWQSGNYSAEKGGFQIAVGLWTLAIEELGKYALLQEASANVANKGGRIEMPERSFKSHRIKLEKGQALLQKWGVNLGLAGIPLTNETRECLWYVAWDDQRQEFRRDLRVLETGAFWKTDTLRELMRLGLNKMQELQRTSLLEPSSAQ
jgi:AbiV family abortive infection protein